MSLINEALKRTRDASYQSSAARPATGDPYRITNGSEIISLGSRTGIMVTVLIVSLAVVATVFFGRHFILVGQKANDGLTSAPTLSRAVTPSPKASVPVAQQVPVKDSPAQGQSATAPATDAEDALVARLLAKVRAEEATAAKAPATPAPEPPRLVLHGVTSQGNSREAMINDYSVREGDEIEGARVVAIETRSVKLRFGERDLVLRMP